MIDTNIATNTILKEQRPIAIWMFGLSGAGKSTIAKALNQKLKQASFHTMWLDGDSIRNGLNNDLGYSEADRNENIRRVAEVTKLFLDNGTIVLASFITPLRTQRTIIQNILAKKEVVLVYIKCSLEKCIERDTKGLYSKAKLHQIKDMTGIDALFEAPVNSQNLIILDTENLSVESCVNQVYDHIIKIIEPKS